MTHKTKTKTKTKTLSDKWIREAMQIKHSPSRDEVLVFAISSRRSALQSAATLANELDPDNLAGGYHDDPDEADIKDGPNEEVGQWAQDLASDLHNWLLATMRLHEIDRDKSDAEQVLIDAADKIAVDSEELAYAEQQEATRKRMAELYKARANAA